MNARPVRRLALGALLLAVAAVFLVYGEHTFVILGRIRLQVF